MRKVTKMAAMIVAVFLASCSLIVDDGSDVLKDEIIDSEQDSGVLIDDGDASVPVEPDAGTDGDTDVDGDTDTDTDADAGSDADADTDTDTDAGVHPLPCEQHVDNYCEGNVLHRCLNQMDGPEWFVEDCADYGDICAPQSHHVMGFYYTCKDEYDCLDSEEPYCSGNTLHYCESNLRVNEYCEDSGQICEAVGDSFECVDPPPPPPECDSLEDNYCDGDVLYHCSTDHFVQIDCADMNSACGMPETGWYNTCVCEPYETYCDGNVLKTCGNTGGFWNSQDCGYSQDCMDIGGGEFGCVD